MSLILGSRNIVFMFPLMGYTNQGETERDSIIIYRSRRIILPHRPGSSNHLCCRLLRTFLTWLRIGTNHGIVKTARYNINRHINSPNFKSGRLRDQMIPNTVRLRDCGTPLW